LAGRENGRGRREKENQSDSYTVGDGIGNGPNLGKLVCNFRKLCCNSETQPVL
jgi:hypothetical protein